MNVLFITFSYLKGNRGGIYASRTHINLFATLSDSMTLLYPYTKGMEPEYIYEDTITMVPVEDNRSAGLKYLNLMVGRRHRFIDVAKKYLDRNKYDTVVFDGSIVSSNLIKLFKSYGFRTITLHHNYEIEYLKGDATPITKPFDLFWTKIQEGTAVSYSDLNLTLTSQDAELLRQNYNPKASIEVLGVFDYWPRKKLQLKNKNRGSRFVITGGLGSKQNEDSLFPWLNTYFPILKGQVENAQLILAGRSPSERLIKVAEGFGAEVIPSPIDMKPILESGDYYICPTDRGGGVKLRIMDGLKSGMPVLTHVVSARGYDEMMDKGLVFSYHDKDSFVESLNQMLKTDFSQQYIYDCYAEKFSFNTGVKYLQKLLIKYGFING